jgi:pimeloyl-ACP methyl ester carboxylesterase
MAKGKLRMRKIILYIALAGVAAALGLAVLRVSLGFAGRVLEKRYPPPGRMIPVADYKLHVYCSGAGSPTIIIEPGMGLDWVAWRFVISRLTPRYTVCVYDRAGYGWSEAGPKPRTALREANELHALLFGARIPGPYILVSHSYGGYISRIYASLFRQSLAGVVLVEPSHEDESSLSPTQPVKEESKPAHSCLACQVLNLLPPLGIQHLRRMYAGDSAVPTELRTEPRYYQDRFLVASSLTQLQLERNEFDSLDLTQSQVRQAVFPRDLPLRVITAAHLYSAVRGRPWPEAPPIHRELQGRLAMLSVDGKQVMALTSGHMVPSDQPELVADTVRELAH